MFEIGAGPSELSGVTFVRILYLVLLLLSMASSAWAEPDVDLSAPTAGWHYWGLTERPHEARVAYPTPPIDRGAQRGRSLIGGRVQGLAGVPQPYGLVVNGNPLPLYTGDQGRFVRPYRFGAGSNSIELRADGRSLRRVQFYEANAARTPARLRILLGWDDPRAELDLHVVTPDGQHAFWSHPVLSDGSGLDVDSVDGPGPEVFTSGEPQQGTYLVYVNYWGNLGSQGYNFDPNSNRKEVVTAQISLVFQENTVNERRETFVVPLRAIGELTLVKSFNN